MADIVELSTDPGQCFKMGNHMTYSTVVEEKKSVPKIRLVHVAQQHSSQARGVLFEISSKHESTVLSQYNVARTILANPDAIVLDEGEIEDKTEEKYECHSSVRFPFTKVIRENIKNDFPKGFPDTPADLTGKQKSWLVSWGAATVLFSLGLINAVYKTHSRDEMAKLANELRKKEFFNMSLYRKIFSDPFSDPELKENIFDRREKALATHVKEAVIKSGKENPLVLVVYGAGHKLGERIALGDLPDILYEGRVMTNLGVRDCAYLSTSAEKLLPCGLTIIPAEQSISIEKLRDIINLYGKKYVSTSFFGADHRSKTIKELFSFVEQAEKMGTSQISYMNILEVLAKADSESARLFRDGLHGPYAGRKIRKATDKVILDLREAFETIPQKPMSRFIPKA